MTNITPCSDHLFLIDLDLPREGFRRFISSWLYRRGETAILIDPGPRASYPSLRAALVTLGVKQLAAVLLTHIHIDHAGGAGLLIADYPDTRFLCHPKGSIHLPQPARLWEESRKVLRDLADDYGEIEPVPKEALFFSETVRFNNIEVRVMETPGHAPHHLCYFIDDLIFAGEVAGIHYPLSHGFYLRPATPAGVRYDLFQTSLEQVSRIQGAQICFGHYGLRNDPDRIWPLAMAQLALWLKTVASHLHENREPFEDIVFSALLAEDPLLADFHKLPKDIQSRERYFSQNGIRGMRQYLVKR